MKQQNTQLYKKYNMILHPKDWILILYFLYSSIYLFSPTILTTAIGIRLGIIPIIILSRWYLSTIYEFHKTRLFAFKNKTLFIVFPHILGVFLDNVHILCAIYLYAEDGLIIHEHQYTFWDSTMKSIDSHLTGIDINEGVGHYLRSLTPPLFNRLFGEYLSLCYILFYFVIASSYLVPSTRQVFDPITTGLIITYIVCLTCYPIVPVTGPFWAYPEERPTGKEIGYFFGPLSQYLIKNKSALGTAFPSSHCAISTAMQVLTLFYHKPLGYTFLFICPGILVATVWLGNHYLIDAIAGFLVGLVCASVTVIFSVAMSFRYTAPEPGTKVYTRTVFEIHTLPDDEMANLFNRNM